MTDKPLICIIGAGRTGRLLIEKLMESWALIVIDISSEKIKTARRIAKNKDITFIEGDASSALVLEKSGVASAFHILVMLNDDNTVIEITKILSTRFNKKNVIARIWSENNAARLRSQGINVITPYETAANLVINEINLGEIIALNIGKGEGEIVQLELTKSSPLIGKKLRELPPKQWIIGAIYRPTKKIRLQSPVSYLKGFQISKEDELIIPDGNTVPRSGDKIILIGDPQILRPTAQYLKAGAPVFPLRHGNHILIILPGKYRNIPAYREFKWLLGAMEPVKLIYIYSYANALDKLKRIKYPSFWKKSPLNHPEFQKSSTLSFFKIFMGLKSKVDVGLIIYKKPDTLFLKQFHKYWTLPRLMNSLKNSWNPVWIIQGSKPVKKITLYVSLLEDSHRVTELAIDAAKKIGLKLNAIQVNPPSLLAGESQSKKSLEVMRSVHEIAALYGMSIEERTYSGNPVFETLKNVGDDELLILPYPVSIKPGFLMPPISEKLLFKRFKGSILALPI